MRFIPPARRFLLSLWFSLSSCCLLADDGWRRTTDGWEYNPPWLHIPEQNWTHLVAAVHPLCVGCLMLLLSVGALVAFTPKEGRQTSR